MIDSRDTSSRDTNEIDVRALRLEDPGDGDAGRKSAGKPRSGHTEGSDTSHGEETSDARAGRQRGRGAEAQRRTETDEEPRRRRRRRRRKAKSGEEKPREQQRRTKAGEPAVGERSSRHPSRETREAKAPTEEKPSRVTKAKGGDRAKGEEKAKGGDRAKPTSKTKPTEKTQPAEKIPGVVDEGEITTTFDEVAQPPLELEGEALDRNLLYSLVERPTASDERKIAVFCDFENIAIGVRESEIKNLDINLVLARLLQKGKIIVKKAYADWERYSEYKRPFHEAAIELIDIPQKYYSGKNSADIKMVVDAMDLCYSKEHLDTFVIVSGDSDFSPLVSKLKENNKYVIGIGVKNSSSSLLIDNCDEFIYYEDVWRMAQQRPHLDNLPPKQAEAFGLMSDAMLALMRENKDVLWGSLIKQTMQRMRPSFNESYYGYNTFTELLEDAARRRIIGLRRDQRSGNWVVTGFVVRR